MEQGVKVVDMLGNLAEWSEDWYHVSGYYFEKIGERGTFSPQGIQKVVRGGSWANEVSYLDERTRGSLPPEWCSDSVGFRPVAIMD
jgi:formylglycine-generating enzyme required for sulfatase activity